MNHLLSTVNITNNIKLFSLATKINSNIYIVSIDSDLLFTHEENKITFDEISKHKKNVYLKTIISDHGHDAFLMEFKKIGIVQRHGSNKSQLPIGRSNLPNLIHL